jgi:type 1 glutamine amidotransferase
MIGRLLALCIGAWLLVGASPPPSTSSVPPPAILIFSHTTGYRHASIEPAVAAIRAIAKQDGLLAIASEDPAVFDDAAALRGYRAIILLNTTTRRDDPTSEWFTGERRDALQGFVRAGGGIVAIHAAADSHYHWPWYGQMIGGRFARHPEGTPEGAVARTASAHPATAPLADAFRIADEWYWFADLSPTLDTLLTLDPASIREQGANPAPVAWAHTFEGGRVFYTGLGHRPENWSDARLLAHVRGGIAWAANTAKAPAMVVIDQRDTVRDEPPPHGRIGMSTAYRMSDGVPGRTMEFRRRDLHVGAAIGIHPIDHDEVYYVLSGEGDVTSDGVTRRLTPGMAAYLYTGAQVGIRQVGNEPLSLIISYPIPGK